MLRLWDSTSTRCAGLKDGTDRTREVDVDDLRHVSLVFTTDPAALKHSDFYIVTVPTPIDDARRPDLRAMFAASRSVGAALKKGDIVVYESTVYPARSRRTALQCLPKGQV